MLPRVKQMQADGPLSIAVDKIIIAQDSLRDFVNAICPGAYLSLTRVDFKALDNLALKPVGVYGSKEEIVRFLSSIGAVDDTTSELRFMFLSVAHYSLLQSTKVTGVNR